MFRSAGFAMFVLSLLLVFPLGYAEGPKWTPIKDEVYLQETGYQLRTDTPVLSVGVYQGAVYAGFGDGVRLLKEFKQLEPVTGAPEEPVTRMKCAGNALWAMTNQGIYRFTGGPWTRVAEGGFVDVCEHLGTVVAATGQSLFRWTDDRLVPWGDAAPNPIVAIASYAETLYGVSKDGLFTFDGKNFADEAMEFGSLPEKRLRDLLSFGNRLIVASHGGLREVRGTSVTKVLSVDELPWDEATNLERGFAEDYWVGATKGAIRVIGGDTHYFRGARWLPDDVVNAIACGPQTVYIATPGGLGIIDYEPFTLLKKAAYYERHIEEWGQKRMAFVHKLDLSPDKGWLREVSDNDVGWSTHYWAAQAFKYAVTKDPQARQQAVDGFNAMKWSEEITGIRGFPARAVWAVGETGIQAQGGSGGFAAEWHRTADGLWEWKGDTSSDETDAQYYYAGIFYDLVANDREKALVREHVDRVSTHIIDHGWTLCDVDGKPTVWARWDPEYLHGVGRYAMGLNGLEILTYIRTTQVLTGDPKFETAMRQLLDMNYTDQIIRLKLLSTKHAINHSDDRLAFYCFYTALGYETDPAVRSVYQRGIERMFELERIEQVPWFNFIYGARTGHDCELPQAVKHLQEWPLDLIKYGYDQADRQDLATPRGYVNYTGIARPISPRERNAMRWSHATPDLVGHSRGTEVEDPSGWLDAYWMARYHGMILAPETTDPALITVAKRGLQLGAKPYDGPAMPDVLGKP